MQVNSTLVSPSAGTLFKYTLTCEVSPTSMEVGLATATTCNPAIAVGATVAVVCPTLVGVIVGFISVGKVAMGVGETVNVEIGAGVGENKSGVGETISVRNGVGVGEEISVK